MSDPEISKLREIIKDLTEVYHHRVYGKKAQARLRSFRDLINKIGKYMSSHEISLEDFIICASDIDTPLHVFSYVCNYESLRFFLFPGSSAQVSCFAKTEQGVHWPVTSNPCRTIALIANRYDVDPVIQSYTAYTVDTMSTRQLIEALEFSPSISDWFFELIWARPDKPQARFAQTYTDEYTAALLVHLVGSDPDRQKRFRDRLFDQPAEIIPSIYLQLVRSSHCNMSDIDLARVVKIAEEDRRTWDDFRNNVAELLSTHPEQLVPHYAQILPIAIDGLDLDGFDRVLRHGDRDTAAMIYDRITDYTFRPDICLGLIVILINSRLLGGSDLQELLFERLTERGYDCWDELHELRFVDEYMKEEFVLTHYRLTVEQPPVYGEVSWRKMGSFTEFAKRYGKVRGTRLEAIWAELSRQEMLTSRQVKFLTSIINVASLPESLRDHVERYFMKVSCSHDQSFFDMRMGAFNVLTCFEIPEGSPFGNFPEILAYYVKHRHDPNWCQVFNLFPRDDQKPFFLLKPSYALVLRTFSSSLKYLAERLELCGWKCSFFGVSKLDRQLIVCLAKFIVNRNHIVRNSRK